LGFFYLFYRYVLYLIDKTQFA